VKKRLWRKKPCVVEAIEFDGTEETARAIGEELGVKFRLRLGISDPHGQVMLLEAPGSPIVPPGHFVVKHEDGEVHSCYPKLFRDTFEFVDRNPPIELDEAQEIA